MGIFSRQNDSDNNDEDFSSVDLPSQKDLNPSFLEDSDFSGASTHRTPTRKPDYDIEKAIQLMNSLPQGEAQLVVTVVQQTLESTGVDVGDIIRDADHKEKRLNDRHKELRENIQSLEAQIADKNQKIKVLLEDLKVTSHVKQQLLLTQKTQESKTETNPSTTASQATNTDTASTAAHTTTKVKAQPQNLPPSKPVH